MSNRLVETAFEQSTRSSVKWFYANRQEAEGPVAEEILVHLVRTGKLSPETLIWREGQSAWRPAAELLPGLDFRMERDAPPPSLPRLPRAPRLYSDPEQFHVQVGYNTPRDMLGTSLTCFLALLVLTFLGLSCS